MKNKSISIAAFVVFVIICFFYYSFFADPIHYKSSILYGVTNIHDHLIYKENIEMVRSGESLFEFANDKGIASVYLLLSYVLPFLVTEDMELMSFIINIATLFVNFLIYSKISDKLGLGIHGRMSFFVNLSFIYFSQLINKDMLTIYCFLLAAMNGLERKYWNLLILLPFFLFVRMQLVVFVLLFVFFSIGGRLWLKVLLAYLTTSLLMGYLSVTHPIIGEESLGGGFNSYVIEFNSNYLVGYLLFNPVRVIQYVVDAYLSFSIFTEDGAVDVAKVLRIPVLTLFIFLYPSVQKLFFNINLYLKTPVRPLILVILAYLITWLMSPIVNARYVMLITPIVLLAILYVRAEGLNGRLRKN